MRKNNDDDGYNINEDDYRGARAAGTNQNSLTIIGDSYGNIL